MTNQEAFNKVWQTFIVEKAPQSKLWFGLCSYGKPGTTGCSVACLLSPEDRETAWRLEREAELGDSLSTSITDFYTRLPSVSGVALELLQELQHWHDLQFSDTAYLRYIARKFSLTVPEAA